MTKATPKGSGSVMATPKTPAEAAAMGLRWYLPEAPCPRGHISKRSVSNRECRACAEAKKAEKRAASPDVAREKERARYHRNGDKKREQMRASREKHIEQRRRDDKSRYPREAERRKAHTGKYWRAHRDYWYALAHQRRASVKRATPGWLTQEDRDKMTALYIEARNRPGEWHVDHIIPLRGKLVCGLHVPSNLQILSGVDNVRKSNSFDPSNSEWSFIGDGSQAAPPFERDVLAGC